MNIAIETVKKIDSSAGLTTVNVGEQVEFRRQLLNEIEKQIIDFEAEAGADPLYMSARDFLIESFQMLSSLTSTPQYLDQDIVDKSAQIQYRLTTLNENLFDLVFEAEMNLRTAYFALLENLNKYGRLNSVERTLLWVRTQFEETQDKMCRFVGLPEVFSYQSQIGEFGFSLFKFDQQTAMRGKRGVLKALDADYGYNAYSMYNWFSGVTGELCAQVYSQRFGTTNMKGAYRENSQGRLQARIHEIGTGTDFSMGQLSGQTNATFAIDR